MTEASEPYELTEVTVNSTSEVNSSTVMNNTSQSPSQPQDTAINIDNRFGPSCASVLSDTEIANSIFERSKRLDRQRWGYLCLGCVPTCIITCCIWIIRAILNCEECSSDSDVLRSLLIAGIVFASVTGIIFCGVLFYGRKHYSNGQNFEYLRNSVRCVVKLEGEQWISYVNYLYGPGRSGFTYIMGAVGACSFCCRAPHYRQLIERGYGYIVVCKHGFLLDEMFSVVRNHTHFILKVTVVLGMGLRLSVLRTDAQVMVSTYDSAERRAQKARQAAIQQTVPLDIYLPRTMPVNVVGLLAYQVQHEL